MLESPMHNEDSERRRGLVMGQHIAPEKRERAAELRREMTPEEAILWMALRSNQIPGFHFRRQQVIDGFIADFYCHAVGLVIEVDGGIHQSQQDYDRERDTLLRERGLRVCRFKNEDIRTNLRSVIRQITVRCQETR